MRQVLFVPILFTLDWLIKSSKFITAVLGGLRFFLINGASLNYLIRRRKWYESSMLGRKMGLKDFLQFGAWHVEIR